MYLLFIKQNDDPENIDGLEMNFNDLNELFRVIKLFLKHTNFEMHISKSSFYKDDDSDE